MQATHEQARLLRESLLLGSRHIQQLVMRLPRSLDETEVRRGIAAMMRRHPLVGANLAEQWCKDPDGLPELLVGEAVSPVLNQVVLNGEGLEAWQQQLELWLGDDRGRGFAQTESLQRWTSLPVPGGGLCLIWTHHRAVVPEASLAAMLHLLLSAALEEPVESVAATTSEPLPNDTQLQRRRDVFADYLQGLVEPTLMDLGPVSEGELQPTRHAVVELKLPPGDVDRLEAAAQARGVELRALVHAAWAVLLGQYNDAEDVVFGTFFNAGLVPLRARLDHKLEVVSLWEQLKAGAQTVCGSEISVEEIEESSELAEGQTLFHTLCEWKSGTTREQLHSAHHLLADADLCLHRESGVPLTLRAARGGSAPASGLELSLEYDVERYERRQCERLLQHLALLLEQMATRPEQTLGQLSVLSQAEEASIHAALSASMVAPAPSFVVPGFLHQVEERPEQIAVSFRNESRTYLELEENSRKLAHRLRELGVGPESLVAVCLPKRVECPEALLAVLRAGAAYVPLDPEEAPARLRAIAQDCGAEVVVSQRSLGERFDGLSLKKVFIDGSLGRPKEVVLPLPLPDSAAYVIYTSGTTGKPKGVVVEHQQLAHHLAVAPGVLGMEPGQGCLQFASFSFDVSVEELFTGLVTGCRLVLRTPEMLGSTQSFLRAIEKEDIAVANLPTAFFHATVNELAEAGRRLPSCLSTIIVGGEKVPHHALQQFQKASAGKVRFINGYGPTETTVTSTALVLEKGESYLGDAPIVSVGRALAGSPHRIVDAQNRLLPVGAVGELLIGGPRVARGYLRREELTKDRFIELGSAGRFYRTGDRVRLGSDGNIHFVGRRDHQVKVRGFRVELGEIESVLLEHEQISEAVVIEHPPQSGRLVACACTQVSGLTAADLVQHCRQRLLPHMIPPRFALLSELPVNRAGKLDRARLLELSETAGGAEAGESELTGRAREIEKIWCELLEVTKVGLKDSFFELGGHSLLAVRMFSRVENMSGAKVDVRDFFRDPTIACLVDSCEKQQCGEPQQQGAQALSLNQQGEQGGSDVASLIPLQAEGDGTPLYLVCGIELYMDLAQQLGPDQPTFGLFLPAEARIVQGMDKDGAPTEVYPTVEELAAGYVKGILAHQPVGPYRVGGISFGGVLAYEVARQLREQDHEIETLILLDSFLPSAWTFRWQAWAKKRVMGLLKAPQKVGKSLLPAIKKRLGKTSNRNSRREQLYDALLEGESKDRKSLHALRTKAYHDAAHRYEPQMRSYEGDAILIRAINFPKPTGYELDARYGWGPRIRGKLTVYDVPGDHIGIIKAPNVSQLAEYLREGFESSPPTFDELLERHEL